MAAELRWILLGLAVPLLAGIWWWTVRRTGQAPGNAELRESTPPLDPRYADFDDEMTPEPPSREWGVPPFEPLNIRTADFEHVPVLDGPMMVNADPQIAHSPAPVSLPRSAPSVAPAVTAAVSSPAQAAPSPAHTAPAPMQTAPSPVRPAPSPMRAAPTLGSAADNTGRFAASPPAPNTEQQRIVTIRVSALGEARWSGVRLMAALESHGLAFGRYQVFHRKHIDGRSLFCAASLVEPGTFDVGAMADQEFRGVTLFAVLPGPIEPLETMDELFGTARSLAEELSGMVQDGKGVPLSPQRAAALREDVARFQASLPRN